MGAIGRGVSPFDEEEDPDLTAQLAALDEIANPSTPARDDLELEASPPAKVGAGKPGAGSLQPDRPVPVPPRGYGAGNDAQALDKAQKDDTYRQAARDTSASLYATFARKPMPKAEGASDAANLMQRRQGMDAEQAMTERQRKIGIEAGRDDASSEASRGMHALVRATDKATADQIGPYLDRMSYNDVLKFLPHMKSIAAKKTKSGLDAAGEAAVDREILKIDPSFNPSGMPYEVKKAILDAKMRGQGIQNTRNHQGVVEQQGADRLVNQGRQLAQGDTRLSLHAKAQGMHVAQSQVPGYAPIDPNIEIDPTRVAKFTDGVKAKGNIDRMVAESLEILDRNGGRVLPGTDDAVRLGQIAIALQPNITTATGQGAFTNGHQHLTQQMGGDPGSLMSFVRPSTYRTTLLGLQKEASDGLTSTAESSNLRALKQGEAHPKSRFAPDAPGAGPTVVETRHLDDGRVIEKMSDGSKRVR